MALVLAATLIAVATTLAAQTPAPQTPEMPPKRVRRPIPEPEKQEAPPTADPFIKNGGTQPAAVKPGSVRNLGMIFEIYSLDQSDAARLIADYKNDQQFYNQVRDLAKEGKARLENVIGDVMKSGNRSTVELIDEVRYAAGYKAVSSPDETAVPTEFVTRNTGETLEYELQLAQDNRSCLLNFVIQKVRFGGFENISSPAQPKTVFTQPRFETQKITASEVVGPGVMRFIGTLSAAPQFQAAQPKREEEKKVSSRMKLVFGHLDVADIAVPNSQASQSGGGIELQLSFYSLSQDNARAILNEISKPGAVYASLQPLLEHHQAQLERLLVLKTPSGKRATMEEIEEEVFLNKLAPKPDDKGVSPDKKNDKPAGNLAEFSTRNTGITFEVEAMLEPNNSVVDLNMVPQMVRKIGDLKGQPVFETRKVCTSFSTLLGEQAFIGTFSQPADTGVNMQKDADLVWLGFVRVNLVQP